MSSKRLPAARNWLGEQGSAQSASIQVTGLPVVHVAICVDVYPGVCWPVDIAASHGWLPALALIVAECKLLSCACCLAIMIAHCFVHCLQSQHTIAVAASAAAREWAAILATIANCWTSKSCVCMFRE